MHSRDLSLTFEVVEDLLGLVLAGVGESVWKAMQIELFSVKNGVIYGVCAR